VTFVSFVSLWFRAADDVTKQQIRGAVILLSLALLWAAWRLWRLL